MCFSKMKQRDKTILENKTRAVAITIDIYQSQECKIKRLLFDLPVMTLFS
jgi:hypothetical protein